MFVNIYNNMESYIIKVFSTKDEAEQSVVLEKLTERKNKGVLIQVTTYCKRVYSLPLVEYLALDVERDAILDKATLCKANKRFHASLVKAYNRFWLELGKQ